MLAFQLFTNYDQDQENDFVKINKIYKHHLIRIKNKLLVRNK